MTPLAEPGSRVSQRGSGQALTHWGDAPAATQKTGTCDGPLTCSDGHSGGQDVAHTGDQGGVVDLGGLA